jgi:hypothetical protein
LTLLCDFVAVGMTNASLAWLEMICLWLLALSMVEC